MSSSTEAVHRADEAPKTPPQPSDAHDEHKDAEKNFDLKSLRFWTIVVSIYLSIFLVALDRLIIATAIPSITNEFNSIEDIGWYGSAYMLTCAIFNPLFGRIFQLYKVKWVFLSAIVIFEVGSAVCGAAPSSVALVIGRAIAGIGAAGIFTGGIVMFVPLVPLRKRPIFVAFFGMAFGVCSVLGPIVGGAFTEQASLTWRWCFYINLPIGGFTIAAVFLLLHLDSPPQEKLSLLNQLKRLDPLGLFFFVPSMVCLVLALQWGGTTYPWSAPRIIGLLVTFGITFIAFMIVEIYTPDTAMAPTRVFLDRSVGSSLVFMMLVSGSMMLVIYYLSIWFQAAQDQSPLRAGVRTIPMIMSFIIVGIVVAGLTQILGHYTPFLLLSPVLCAVGCGMLSTLAPSAGSNHWIGYQVIFGLGIGCGFQSATLVPQNVLSRTDIPIGTALIWFMQQIGGAIFLAIGQNIFSSRLVGRLSGAADLNVDAIVNDGATAIHHLVPPNEIGLVVNAYSYALTRVFVLAAVLSSVMILSALGVEWKSIKKSDKGKSEHKVDTESGTCHDKSGTSKSANS